MIDSAAFPNAAMAVERKEPELRLMTIVENLGDDGFLAKMIPRLLERPLSEVARSADFAQMYEPLGQAHESFVKLVAQSAQRIGHVVLVDVSASSGASIRCAFHDSGKAVLPGWILSTRTLGAFPATATVAVHRVRERRVRQETLG